MKPPSDHKPYHGSNPTADHPPNAKQLLETGKVVPLFPESDVMAYADDMDDETCPCFEDHRMVDPRYTRHYRHVTGGFLDFMQNRAPQELKDYTKAAMAWVGDNVCRRRRYPWVDKIRQLIRAKK